MFRINVPAYKAGESEKRNGFPVLYFNLILLKLPIFLILLAGRVLGKTIICIFHMLASDVLSCYWSLCLESIFMNLVEWHHFA